MALTPKERTLKHSEDYREWIKNGTPEQKELWAREQKLQGKPEHRVEYMAIVERLQTFVVIDKDSYGHYSRASNHESDSDYFSTGMKVHLRKY